MPSSTGSDLSSSSSEPFQSAQRPSQHFEPEQVDLKSSDEELNTPHPNAATTSHQDAPNVSGSSVKDDVDASHGTSVEEDSEISEDDFLVEASSPSRPNKYHGPASTWRSWTAPERDLTASLDQLTAQDLSIHLYNAFKLKKRAKNHYGPRQIQISNQDVFQDILSWDPPKIWTAWPLPPEEVPREDDRKDWEGEGIRRRQPASKQLRSGEILKELLAAQALNHARKRFLKRSPEDLDAHTSMPDQKSPIQQPAKAPIPSHSNKSAREFKPVVMTDDERAGQILRPPIQHILSKLDHLLMALHYARSSYYEIDEDASDSQGQVNERSTSRRTYRKRKRDTSSFSAQTGEPSGLSRSPKIMDEPNDRSVSRSKKRPRKPRADSSQVRKQRLGLRDWSDVLGVASMTGWDSKVVEATASRCASLFGEGIMLRTLDEGITGFTEQSYLPNHIVSLIAEPGESIPDDEKTTGEMFGGVHVDGFLTPIAGKKSWKYPNRRRSKKRNLSLDPEPLTLSE